MTTLDGVDRHRIRFAPDARRRRQWTTGVVVALTLPLAVVSAEGTGRPQQDDALVTETLELLRTPSEHHRHLERLIGTWAVEGRYFLPSGEPTDFRGTIESSSVMDGLFVESRLVAELVGQPYHGRIVDGYDTVTERYVATFFENIGPGIVWASGVCEEEGRVRTLMGEVPDPVWGGTYTLRSVHTFIDDDTYRYDAFLAHEDGREFKQMEYVATRR